MLDASLTLARNQGRSCGTCMVDVNEGVLQNVMVLYSENATWNATQYTLAYLLCKEHFSGVLNVFLDLDQKGHGFSAVK